MQTAWGSYQLWWNSFDFSVRLAYLILDEQIARDQLTILCDRVESLRRFEVDGNNALMTAVQIAGKGMNYTWGASIAFGIAFPPLFPVFVGTLALQMGCGFVLDIYDRIQDRKRMSEYLSWQQRSRALENRFLELIGLIDWNQGRYCFANPLLTAALSIERLVSALE